MKKFGERFAIALAASLVAMPAFATSPADTATARELYKQGADALDAGNAIVAVAKLTAAWALVQTPVIGLDLARAQEKLDHLVESREAALEVVRLPKAPNETPLSGDARNRAERLSDALSARIPHVKIVVTGADMNHVTVNLDGASIPSVALVEPRQTNPGKHMIMVDTDDGRHAEMAIIVGETESKLAKLELPNAAAPLPPLADPPHTPETEPHTPRAPDAQPQVVVTHTSPVVWAGVAIAATGFVVGAISGAIALSDSSALGRDCNAANVCGNAFAGELSSAQAVSTISTIGFITAGVGVGVFVTGLIIGPTRTAATRAKITPILGPVSGLSGSF